MATLYPRILDIGTKSRVGGGVHLILPLVQQIMVVQIGVGATEVQRVLDRVRWEVWKKRMLLLRK